MPIAEFPLPSNGANPDPLITYKLPIDYQVSFTEYDDGGRDFKMQSGGSGIQRWYLFYDGLNEAEAAILDAHVETAKQGVDGMSAFTFNLRDPDTALLYSGVRYQSFERPVHKLKAIQTRTILLVKFP